MPKLDTAQHLGLPVHAPERAHVPSQTLADSPQYSQSSLFDRLSFRQDLRDRVLYMEALLYAFAFRHVDVCADHLDNLSIRGKYMMASCGQIFDCPIWQHNFELAHVIFFLA